MHVVILLLSPSKPVTRISVLPPLGNSDALKVGDWAVAIGSPFGLFSSVTTGIISAIGRNGGPDGNISDFIQTDAAINRGNSGGALANIRGEVIGVNTWIASTTGGSVGLGFSIPINNAKKAIEDIISGGSVKYGWLGVLLSSPDKQSLADLGLGERRGAMIGNVFSDGPAGKYGILPGDFVVAIDGRTVASIDQLVRIVGDFL
jgi:S1-C subfamily serine protease